MGESSLWIFIRPLIFGVVGFKETCLHFASFGMMSLHSLMAVLTMGCSFCAVLWNMCDVIFVYEVVHFVIIVCFRQNYHGVALVCFSNYSLGCS